MRVLFCKIHCPFICFCKSSSHLYTAGPLKLESTPHVPSSAPVSLPDAPDKLSSETTEVKEEKLEGKLPVGNMLKSSLRKAQPSEPGAAEVVNTKRVQWMDFSGKELVEIKEFESSETGDPNNEDEENRSCLCIIL